MKQTLSLILLLLIASYRLVAQPSCAIKNDFSFSRNLCSPLSVSFLTNSTGYNSIYWDFGNGSTTVGTSSPTNAYNNAGNYQIKMIQNYGTCIDTVIKQVSVDLKFDNQLLQTPDTTICFGASLQLQATPTLNFCWSPSTYLNNPAISNPVSSTPQNITYNYNTEIRGGNLITNGDFSQGNVGFSSDYLYSASNGVPEGVYNVGTDIILWHPTMQPCSDHTVGNGNMMMVNGATVPDVTVWKQTVAVQPNTNYQFSTWLQHITSVNPAKLQFSINGIHLGYIFQANSTSCIWDRFFTTWNSGNNTTAIISIINKNTINTGNDFALDDIFFGPVIIKSDSVIIKVRSVNSFTINPPVNICTNSSVQLKASGGDIYLWQPAGSLNNSTSSNPIASPNTTTTYSARITDTLCNSTATLSTVVTVLPLPTIKATKSNDIDCSNRQSQLIASGGSQYSWAPAGSLDNPNSATPIASPPVTTQYLLTGTNVAGCKNYDSIVLNVSNVSIGDYLMPTAFTPNNDGLNDCYGIKSWGTILELDFSIFNRWGERVFHSNQPGECWDGKYKNISQNTGVFIYMVKAKTVCSGSVFRKGTFVLVR